MKRSLMLLLATSALVFAQSTANPFGHSPLPAEFSAVDAVVTIPISSSGGSEQLTFTGTLCDTATGRTTLSGALTNPSKEMWTKATLVLEFQAKTLRFTHEATVDVRPGTQPIRLPMSDFAAKGGRLSFPNCLALDGERIIHRVLSATLKGMTDTERAAIQKREAEAKSKEDEAAFAYQKKTAAEYKAQQAKEAARRAELRRKCKTLYEGTHNVRVADLTVEQSQEIDGCRRLGLYRP